MELRNFVDRLKLMLISKNSDKNIKKCDMIKTFSSEHLDSLMIESNNEIFYCITLIPFNDVVLAKEALSVMLLLLSTPKSQIVDYCLFQEVLNWLKTGLLQNQFDKRSILCIIKMLFNQLPEYTYDIFETILYPLQSVILQCFDPLLLKNNTGKIDLEEIKLVIEIINLVFNDETLENYKKENCQIMKKIIETVATYVLRIFFSQNLDKESLHCLPLITFPLFAKVATLYPEYIKLHIGELLGLVKSYMHFNLEGSKMVYVKELHISQQSVHTYDETSEGLRCQRSGGKISKTLKPRLSKNTISVDFADSFLQNLDIQSFALKCKLSGTESEDTVSFYGSIRLAALTLLEILLKKLDNHMLYGFWYAFFPSHSLNTEGILNIAILDSNSRCRLAALQIATRIIFESKIFLEQAEINDKSPASYTPFSLSLGKIVHTMYKTLSQAIEYETSPTVLTSALKCLAVLVRATPFHRMNCDLVCFFLIHIKKLVYHTDSSIQLSALMVMDFLISTPKKTKEIADQLEIPLNLFAINNLNNFFDNNLIDNEITDEFLQIYEDEHQFRNASVISKEKLSNDHWLLNALLTKLVKPEVETPAAVINKSLQVMTSMSFHFSMLINKLDMVALSIQHTLQNVSTDIRLNASKCLDTIAYNMSKYLVDTSCNDVLCCEKFWISILPIAVEKITDSLEMNALKVCLCDFLSNIGVTIFNLLPKLTQINLLSFLSGIASDTECDTVVRAAAVRALAVYVLYPSMRKDLVFIENTAELAILLAADSNLQVRIKCVWSIGNVSDALLDNLETASNERISEVLLQRLIEISSKSCCDNDKVRCNSVRALGNLMRLVSRAMLDDIEKRKMVEGVSQQLISCIKSSGSAKVKWNSCYALGCLMKNVYLIEALSIYKEFTWCMNIFPALCHAIVEHTNFKVRINATNALISVSDRSVYAQYYNLCWRSVLTALEKSYDRLNNLEYNHHDLFQERLCLALCHIILIGSDDDCLSLKKELLIRDEVIKGIWLRVLHRMTPENAAPLLKCSIFLRERLKCKNKVLTEDQQNSILLIANIFHIM